MDGRRRLISITLDVPEHDAADQIAAKDEEQLDPVEPADQRVEPDDPSVIRRVLEKMRENDRQSGGRPDGIQPPDSLWSPAFHPPPHTPIQVDAMRRRNSAQTPNRMAFLPETLDCSPKTERLI